MKKTNNLKDYTDYTDSMYDEMKSLLNKSRRLTEQVSSVEDIPLERDEEKTKEYDVSSGKIVVHGYTTSDITLTDEEKNAYQWMCCRYGICRCNRRVKRHCFAPPEIAGL